MKWLCRHLGHTRKVHEQHYRATSGLIERLDIAKLMLLQEGNMQGKFQGKSLKDINFEGKSVFHIIWLCGNDLYLFISLFNIIQLTLQLIRFFSINFSIIFE